MKTLERHRDNALFVGFAPAEHPKIAISVMIENGEAGGRVAGPVVRQIMDAGYSIRKATSSRNTQRRAKRRAILTSEA